MFMIVLIIAGVAFQTAFILVEHKKRWGSAVVLKGVASLFFVVLGIYCSLKTGFSQYDKLIVAGLIFGLLGDVFLNLRHVLKKIGDKIFLIGIFAFLIGHFIYLAAISMYAKHMLFDVLIGAVLALALLVYIFKTMEVKLAFKIFGVFYLGAIIIMTVVSIDAAIFMPITRNFIFAAGAILFSASDIVLIFNTFSGKETYPRRIANLSLYYAAQICIALTTTFISL